MPKSRSGPVRVIRTFEPTPPTKEQEYARLLHKRALIETRIDERKAWLRSQSNVDPNRLLDKRLRSLYAKRDDVEIALICFRER